MPLCMRSAAPKHIARRSANVCRRAWCILPGASTFIPLRQSLDACAYSASAPSAKTLNALHACMHAYASDLSGCIPRKVAVSRLTVLLWLWLGSKYLTSLKSNYTTQPMRTRQVTK